MSARPLFTFAAGHPVLRAAWAILAGLTFFATARIARALSARASTDLHVRGARVHVPTALRARSKRRMRPARALPTLGPLRLGGVGIPSVDETKHFKFIGTTGTGKSTAITALLRLALARGDRAVIADPNGACLTRFFDRYRGDVLLNPFEPGSARWNIFGEIRSTCDTENLARGLVPECEDAAGREWRSYARTLVAAILRRLAQGAAEDPAELWRLLAVADTTEVRQVIAGTAAQPFLDPDNARMFGSIRAVASSALTSLAHVAGCRGSPFSIREWIERGRGVLYLPYRADQIAALRALVSTWMRLAIFETLSGAETDALNRVAEARADGRASTRARRTRARRAPQRIWFIVDELDALGAIDGLTDALARLRKFSGCCVLGLQSTAQLTSVYGTSGARAILENCGNTLILRCSASESGGTAAFASQLIGEREIQRRHTVRSRDRRELFARRGARHSIQVARQRVTEAAVLPSEIEQLPDLSGYLKIASSPCWRLIHLAPEVRSWRSTTSE